MAPRYFFFGIIRVAAYEYFWGYTAAQIELMNIDAPFTCYKKRDDNDGKKPGDPGYKPDAKKLNDAVERWKERKRKRTFDMKHYLATGEKIPTKNSE